MPKHLDPNKPEPHRSAERAYERYLRTITKHLKLAGIDGEVLEKYGDKYLGPKFMGVFARDQIPQLRGGQCCIVNNQTQAQGGEHWLGLAMMRSGKLLLYDSFGRKNFLKLGNSVDTEHDYEQNESEENCGNRCLAFCSVFLKLGDRAASCI